MSRSVEELEKRLAEAERLLRRDEWASFSDAEDTNEGECRECGDCGKHYPDCEIGAFLAPNPPALTGAAFLPTEVNPPEPDQLRARLAEAERLLRDVLDGGWEEDWPEIAAYFLAPNPPEPAWVPVSKITSSRVALGQVKGFANPPGPRTFEQLVKAVGELPSGQLAMGGVQPEPRCRFRMRMNCGVYVEVDSETALQAGVHVHVKTCASCNPPAEHE